MTPIISYDSLLTFAKLFGGAILILWIAYECRPVRRRPLLPKPERQCVAGGPKEFVGKP